MTDTPTTHQSLASYWEQQVLTWKSSSLSQLKFCKKNDLTYTRFIYWRSKLEKRAATPPTKQNSSNFVAVKVHSTPKSSPVPELSLSFPNGITMRGISTENVTVVRQLLDQLT